MYYIKVFEKIRKEYINYGYFEKIGIDYDDFYNKNLNYYIDTVSNKKYAKKYKYKKCAENKIEEIKKQTKNKYKLEVIEE